MKPILCAQSAHSSLNFLSTEGWVLRMQRAGTQQQVGIQLHGSTKQQWPGMPSLILGSYNLNILTESLEMISFHYEEEPRSHFSTISPFLLLLPENSKLKLINQNSINKKCLTARKNKKKRGRQIKTFCIPVNNIACIWRQTDALPNSYICIILPNCEYFQLLAGEKLINMECVHVKAYKKELIQRFRTMKHLLCIQSIHCYCFLVNKTCNAWWLLRVPLTMYDANICIAWD